MRLLLGVSYAVATKKLRMLHVALSNPILGSASLTLCSWPRSPS